MEKEKTEESGLEVDEFFKDLDEYLKENFLEKKAPKERLRGVMIASAMGAKYIEEHFTIMEDK